MWRQLPPNITLFTPVYIDSSISACLLYTYILPELLRQTMEENLQVTKLKSLDPQYQHQTGHMSSVETSSAVWSWSTCLSCASWWNYAKHTSKQSVRFTLFSHTVDHPPLFMCDSEFKRFLPRFGSFERQCITSSSKLVAHS